MKYRRSIKQVPNAVGEDKEPDGYRHSPKGEVGSVVAKSKPQTHGNSAIPEDHGNDESNRGHGAIAVWKTFHEVAETVNGMIKQVGKVFRVHVSGPSFRLSVLCGAMSFLGGLLAAKVFISAYLGALCIVPIIDLAARVRPFRLAGTNGKGNGGVRSVEGVMEHLREDRCVFSTGRRLTILVASALSVSDIQYQLINPEGYPPNIVAVLVLVFIGGGMSAFADLAEPSTTEHDKEGAAS